MYKSHKIIMLPSNKFPEVGNINYAPDNSEGYKLELIHYVCNGDGLKPQHLYVLSEDEIQEGDWITDGKYIEKALNAKYSVCKKIIVSTDKFLQLPQISTYLVQDYIEHYNKDSVIKEVDVWFENDNLYVDDNDKITVLFKHEY